MGTAIRVIRTVNGQMWSRADGGQSNGWHLTDKGWVMGKRIQ